MCRLLRANTAGATSSEGFSSYLISDYIIFCDEKRQRAPTQAKLTTLHGWIKRDVRLGDVEHGNRQAYYITPRSSDQHARLLAAEEHAVSGTMIN